MAVKSLNDPSLPNPFSQPKLEKQQLKAPGLKSNPYPFPSTAKKKAPAPAAKKPIAKQGRAPGNMMSALGKAMLEARSKAQAKQEEGPAGFSFGGSAPDLQSFLSQMGDGSGLFSQQLSGMSNQRNDMERRRQEALSAISGSTEALAGDLTESRGQLDERYTQGIAEAAGAQEKAQQAIASQTANAQKTNSDLYASLGISDGVDTSQNAEDVGFDLGQLATKGQAADTEQRNRQLTAYELGTRNVDASRARGTEMQAASNRDYGSALSELMDQETQLRAQAQQQAQQMAMQQYQSALSQHNNDRDFAYNNWSQQQGWAREDARSQLDYEMEMQQQQAKQGMPIDRSKLSDEDALMQQLQGYGVSAGKAGEWLSRINQPSNSKGKNIGQAVANGESFTDYFGGSGPANAALYNYFQSRGLFKK